MKKRYYIPLCAGVVLMLFLSVAYNQRIANRVITANSTVGTRELPIYCVQTDKPQIALTFDMAWGNEDTKVLLDILDQYQVKATFFMTGGWVESFPDDVKDIQAAGHDLGNHGENHKNMGRLSREEVTAEIMDVHNKVKGLTGCGMNLFRPPYGDYDNAVVLNAKNQGYDTVMWDVDSLDWKDYGVEAIVDTVTGHTHLGNGSVILLHGGAQYTAEALETVITTLQAKGYEFVPVSRLILRDRYHMDEEGRQIPD